MHLLFVHCVILSRLPEEQVSEPYDICLWQLFHLIIHEVFGIKNISTFG